eukprot:TRINITY_DN2816_c0_g1_i2.p1 TRINITY_DN2816_c0_g1~~TRINITY_DN2816_c0_g1_i2.p1  ORF type:complete len:461 (-),score=63.22 TRINITY_DN2816_c0_g1_i2:290-1480(-)
MVASVIGEELLLQSNNTHFKELSLLQIAASEVAEEALTGPTCSSLKSCHTYKAGAPCQCNSECSKHENCCPDFAATCMTSDSHYHHTPNGSHVQHRSAPFAGDASLHGPSKAPLLTFYVYRAQSDSNYPPYNTNAASLGGVLWYLHNEIVPYCYTTPSGGKFGFRRYYKTRIIRYKITMRATTPLYRKGMNFGVRMAFDAGKNTGAYGMTKGFENYGYFVGCNILGHGPYPTCPSAQGTKEGFCPMRYGEAAAWYSLPGECPSQTFFSKSPACKKQEPGGFCAGTPTGASDCTWNYEKAGEINIDELVGITPRFKSHYAFCKQGCLEYVKFSAQGKKDVGKCGIHFWDHERDAVKNQWRIRKLDEAFKKKYPHLPSDKEMPAPKCDFDKDKFYDGI